MSHSVVFFRTYEAKKPAVDEKDDYENRRPLRRHEGSWLHTSTMTCRDFTKNSYEYRDVNFQLADKGWRYAPPKCTKDAYQYSDFFSLTEFRKTDLGAKTYRNEKPTVNSRMRASSTSTLTHSNIEVPIADNRHKETQSSALRFETEYRSSYRSK